MPTSKALRQWLGRDRGAAPDRRRPARRLEGADAPRRDRAARRPGRARRGPQRAAEGGRGARRSGSADERRAVAQRWTDAESARPRRCAGELEDAPELERHQRAGRLARAGGRNLRDGDQVLAASSMPVRDQEAFLPAGRAAGPLPLQPRRQRHRRARLDRRRVPLPHRAPAPGPCSATSPRPRPRRPRRRPRGPRACACWCSTTAAAASSTSCPRPRPSPSEEFEALLGTPSGLDLRRAAELFGLVRGGRAEPHEVERPSRGTRGVIVELDRTATSRSTAASAPRRRPRSPRPSARPRRQPLRRTPLRAMPRR